MHTSYSLIPDPAEERVLLLPRGGGWSLPSITRERDAHPYFEPLLEEFREQLGLDLAVRRVAHFVEGQGDEMVLACENRAPTGALPDGGRWVERRDLVGLGLVPPDTYTALPNNGIGSSER